MGGWMMNGLMLQAKLLKHYSKVDLEWDPPHTHTQINKKEREEGKERKGGQKGI